MAEKITNGTFDVSLSGWNNIGARAFVWSGGVARGTAVTVDGGTSLFLLTQTFPKYQTVLSAVLNVTAAYMAADYGGGNRLIVKLKKPSGSLVTLFDQTYEGLTGSVQACDDLDISAHMTENGIYTLELHLQNYPGWDGTHYRLVYGTYDNISLQVAEKYTKSVTEYLGSGETPKAGIAHDEAEGAALSESISHIGGGDGFGFAFDRASLVETLGRALSVARAASMGLADVFARTYEYRKRGLTPTLEGCGVGEYLAVRYPFGNVAKLKVLAGSVPTIWSPRIPVTIDYEQE